MADIGDDLFRARLAQRSRGVAQRAGRIDDVVDQDAVATLNVTDHVHDFADTRGLAALVDDGEVGVDALGDRPGAHHAAVALMDQGAKSVSAYVTHGVLSGGAVARVAASPMEKLVITDSIQPTEAVRISPNVRPLSIATLMAEAMKRISDETSVSSLFD